jgi:dTDP-4-amino-4,6-dideoxygalactose transaminase
VQRILLSPPDVGVLEEQYVLNAIRSGWVAPAGPDLDAFEREMAERIGTPYAVGLASGTAALHLTLVSWGVGPGDVVPVPTLTFAASVNAIRYVGATPHFVDSDESGNMNPDLLQAALDELAAQGRRVPAVVAVDMLGKCADYDRITAVAARHGALVLSDAAESVGASYRGRPSGSLGDAAVLSFNGNKIMTTSGGGMLLTGDERLAAHVRKLANQAREPANHYEHTEIGYNYRLSNLLAALGRAQLARLDEMLKRRRELRDRYRAMFAGRPGVRILGGEDDADDNCWLTAVIVDGDVAGWRAHELGTRLDGAGIESRPVWKPMHLQPVYDGVGGTLDGTAERLFRCGLALPSGSGLSDEQFAHVEATVREVLDT